ncbi:MAG: sodium:proton antiporter [Gammaproteobacteria bacterium]|nr:sodium:proton antiporter [Gammaproteobacteria bacterium]
MNPANFYALVGIGLFCIGLFGMIINSHLLRKILAFNIMGSGVFLVLVALGRRAENLPADPVPHAMVITGIVVAVSATALALTLMIKVATQTGQATLPDEDDK